MKRGCVNPSQAQEGSWSQLRWPALVSELLIKPSFIVTLLRFTTCRQGELDESKHPAREAKDGPQGGHYHRFVFKVAVDRVSDYCTGDRRPTQLHARSGKAKCVVHAGGQPRRIASIRVV